MPDRTGAAGRLSGKRVARAGPLSECRCMHDKSAFFPHMPSTGSSGARTNGPHKLARRLGRHSARGAARRDCQKRSELLAPTREAFGDFTSSGKCRCQEAVEAAQPLEQSGRDLAEPSTGAVHRRCPQALQRFRSAETKRAATQRTLRSGDAEQRDTRLNSPEPPRTRRTRERSVTPCG